MWAGKWNYNEKENKIDIIEFEIKNDKDFSNEPETNLYDWKGLHMTIKEAAIESTEKLNKEIENKETDIIKCKDCGLFFILYKDEKQWFTDNGMVTPKRCKGCRKKNRKKKNISNK